MSTNNYEYKQVGTDEMNMLLSFKSTVYNQAVQVMYGIYYNYSSCRSGIYMDATM